ncbi:MAG: hypothetical protein V1936_00255 [Patescibacteria group bacterium]
MAKASQEGGSGLRLVSGPGHIQESLNLSQRPVRTLLTDVLKAGVDPRKIVPCQITHEVPARPAQELTQSEPSIVELDQLEPTDTVFLKWLQTPPSPRFLERISELCKRLVQERDANQDNFPVRKQQLLNLLWPRKKIVAEAVIQRIEIEQAAAAPGSKIALFPRGK